MNEELKMNFPEFSYSYTNALKYCKEKRKKKKIILHFVGWSSVAILVILGVLMFFLKGDNSKNVVYYYLDDIRPTTYLYDENIVSSKSLRSFFSSTAGDLYESGGEEKIKKSFINLLKEKGIEYRSIEATICRYSDSNEIHTYILFIYFENGGVTITFDVSNYPKWCFDRSDTLVVGDKTIKKDVGEIVQINEYDVVIERYADNSINGEPNYDGYEIGLRKGTTGLLLRESGGRKEDLEKIFNMVVNDEIKWESIIK